MIGIGSCVRFGLDVERTAIGLEDFIYPFLTINNPRCESAEMKPTDTRAL